MATHRTLLLIIMTILCFHISVKQHLSSKTILKTYEKYLNMFLIIYIVFGKD